MKKLLALLLAILLSGCLGANRAHYILINGVIYHEGTDIPISDAQIVLSDLKSTLTANSRFNGSFSLSINTSSSSLTLDVSHPGYTTKSIVVKTKDILQNGSFLQIYLTPLYPELTLVSGRIDYALYPLTSAVEPMTTNDVPLKSIFRDGVELESGEIIVIPYRFEDSTITEIAQSLQSAYYRLYPEIQAVVLGKPENISLADFLATAQAHPWVSQAEINDPVISLVETIAMAPPNDPNYLYQWAHFAMYVPLAWSVQNRSGNVRIAVLDSPMDTRHVDLQESLRLDLAYNVLKGNNDVHDYRQPDPQLAIRPYSHGTHVVGIIGATTNNNEGIAGMSWDIDIVPITILNQNHSGGTVADFIAGVRKAIDLNVDIINMSVGTRNNNSMLHAAIREAAEAGIILIAAAGNTGDNFMMFREQLYPARYPEVISVGALSSNYQIDSYSALTGVQLFAPGSNILSTDLGGRYTWASGTSMAAPHVSGLAALILADNPWITSQELEKLLWDTGICFDLTHPEQRLVNAYAALLNAPIQNSTITFTSKSDADIRYTTQCDVNRCFNQFLAPGDYVVTVHIDSNADGIINPGEWYYQEPITVTANEPISNWEIRLSIYQ